MTGKGVLLALVATLLLGSCSSFREGTLLPPTRGRPDLGVRLRVIPPTGLPAALVGQRQQVLLVVGVYPQRPAIRAGVETGDLLLALDGQSVSGMADSVALMQNRAWGDRVVLTLLRGGRREQLSVLLEP